TKHPRETQRAIPHPHSRSRKSRQAMARSDYRNQRKSSGLWRTKEPALITQPSTVIALSKIQPGNTENTNPAVSVTPIANPNAVGTSYRFMSGSSAGANNTNSQRA